MTSPTTPNGGDLRRLLDDAVSDVHPEGGVDEIRARAYRPSATRWVPITLAAAAAMVVVIAGGYWLAQRQPSNNPPAAGTPRAPASEAPAETGRTVDTTVYYVGATASGPRLFPEARRVTDTTESDVQVAVNEALSGTPKDPDYESAWPLPGTTAKVTTSGSLITVDLTLGSTTVDLEKGAGERALQALVWTADAAAGADLPVQFIVDGQGGDLLGVDASGPIQKASADSVLSTVLIESPTEGATVPTRFTVTGRAATFEANVVWELKRGRATVRNGFTTAQECCTLAPYSFTVTAPPGDYTLVVRDTDESDGEGIGTTQDTKAVTVE